VLAWPTASIPATSGSAPAWGTRSSRGGGPRRPAVPHGRRRPAAGERPRPPPAGPRLDGRRGPAAGRRGVPEGHRDGSGAGPLVLRGLDHPREGAEGLRLSDVAAVLRTLEDSLAAGKRHHPDGFVRLLAETLLLKGDREGAILALEESVRVPWSHHGSGPVPGASHRQLLEKYRALVAPDLVSFASIDAAIEGARGGPPEPGAGDPILAFRSTPPGAPRPVPPGLHRGPAPPARGEAPGGRRVLRRVIAAESRFPEPHLRRAESLRAAGEASRAGEELRAVLSRRGLRYADLWNLWLQISFVDLRRGPAEVLADLPKGGPAIGAPPRAPIRIPSRYGEDVKWLLERLSAGEPARINCGGDDWGRPGGPAWGGDRFYTVGGRGSSSAGGSRRDRGDRRRPGLPDGEVVRAGRLRPRGVPHPLPPAGTG